MTKSSPDFIAVFLAVLFFSAAGFFGCAGPVKSERLSTLLELKKEQDVLSEALEQDMKNFEALREAIAADEIKPGLTSELVKSKVGEPLIVYSEAEGEKWMYKEDGEDWFGGSKIYLFFDSAGKFSKYQCIRLECPSS